MLTKQAIDQFISRIFNIDSEECFNQLCLEAFKIQFQNNPVYREFVGYLKPDLRPGQLTHYRQIPFLPIDLFKTRKVFLDGFEPETYFQSSGTTSQGAVHSRHYLGSLDLYSQCFTQAFRTFWGDPSEYAIIALLPNYLEQPHSSLICMMKELISLSRHPLSGFYLYDIRHLAETLKELEKQGQKTWLIGVTYALLDLAEQNPLQLKHTYVLETGGMKGRRKEMVKEELYPILKKGLGVDNIFSEYGMCELMSQAYSFQKEMLFSCPPWMKVMIRQTHNPLDWECHGHGGGVNVIDLGNIYSCPFIATQDMGKIHPDGSFSILGRFDSSDVRGCNLMVI